METDKMIERDAQDVLGALGESVDRLSAAAGQLEKTIAWLEDRHAVVAGAAFAGSAVAGAAFAGPAFAGEVEHVVAAIEEPAAGLAGVPTGMDASFDMPAGPTRRETELERRLDVAENQIAELRAQSSQMQSSQASSSQIQASRPVPTRKTLPALAANLLAKHGLSGVESIEAGTLDAALTGLSLEQRIAVKSQLLRAGALV